MKVKIYKSQSLGFKEFYYECFKCPKCENDFLGQADNFCSECGSGIDFIKDVGFKTCDICGTQASVETTSKKNKIRMFVCPKCELEHVDMFEQKNSLND